MHYKNGRQAKAGDPVVGTTYNRQGVQVGIVVGITPGMDTCNCRVAICDTSFAAGRVNAEQVIKIESAQMDSKSRVHKEFQEDGLYAVALLTPVIDYSECKALLHAEDALLAVKG